MYLLQLKINVTMKKSCMIVIVKRKGKKMAQKSEQVKTK